MPIVDTIYRNPSRWRAVIHTNDVRHGTAGCLLSLVLLAPLFVRQLGMVTIATFVIIYSLIVVPSVTKFFSPVKITLKIARTLKRGLQSIRKLASSFSLHAMANYSFSSVSNFIETFGSILSIALNVCSIPLVCAIYCLLPCIHGFYIAFEGFRITSNQVVFFIMCEKIFSHDVRLVSLYFLLFYTVLAYLYKSLVTRQWSHSFYESNIRDFLKLTTWFVAVRLGKGVAMSFVLIIFTMKFNNVEPNLTFVAVTFAYFALTQKEWTGNEKVVCWVKYLRIDLFEEEEDYWVPFSMKIIPLVASVVMMLFLITSQQLLCFVACYTNIVVPYLLLQKQFKDYNSIEALSLLSFRKASSKEIDNSRTCPICLDPMRGARVTPCNHVYHAACLRRCLCVSTLCPLCKQDLTMQLEAS